MRYGGKYVLLFSAGWAMLCSFLTPVSTHSFPGLLFVRTAMGVGESMSYPAIVELLSKWAPPKERSRLCSIAYAGAYVGTIFSLFMTPVTMKYGYGWPFSFYLYAAHGSFACCIWWIFGANSPAQDDRISPEELNYHLVASGAATAMQKVAPSPAAAEPDASNSVPTVTQVVLVQSNIAGASTGNSEIWHTLLRSKAVWAIIVQNFCINWSLYVLISWLPDYFSQKWKVDVHEDVS